MNKLELHLLNGHFKKSGHTIYRESMNLFMQSFKTCKTIVHIAFNSYIAT